MLVSLCRHQLRCFANLTGETVHLAVRERHLARFVDHHTPRNEIIAVSARTGKFMPLHRTAQGKALLADCSLDDLRFMFGDSQLETHTRQTVESNRKVGFACAEVKAQSCLVHTAEFLEEVRSSPRRLVISTACRDRNRPVHPDVRLPERMPVSARRVLQRLARSPRFLADNGAIK